MQIQSINAGLYTRMPSFGQRSRVNQVNYNHQKYHPPYYVQSSGVIKLKNQGCRKPTITPSEKTYDSFTGMRDKRYLLATLGASIRDSKHTQQGIAVAMFDMDNFKSVNELLGYETGDMFIQTISRNIDSVAKKNQVPAYRFGGEEFVIIFDKQSDDEQKAIVDKILSDINGNADINSQKNRYKYNAETRLQEYSESTRRISDLMQLQAKKEIYQDLHEHLSTEEAKNDPYLLESMRTTDEKLYFSYLTMLNERISNETDEKYRLWLISMREKMNKHQNINEAVLKVLDEYLKSVYDKTAEMYQLKKWLYDFDANKGFSITGGVVSFEPSSLKTKTPMDLINIAGEALKEGKQSKKGKSYYHKN